MKKLPQIPRFISALDFDSGFRILLWCCLVYILMINISAKINFKSALDDLAGSALTKSANRQVHLELARLFFRNGNLNQARLELTQAQSISAGASGDSRDIAALMGIWQNEPLVLKGKYDFWMKIVRDKPDYRDGYIMAATSAYDLGKTEEAKSLIHQALEFDPNYQPAATIAKLLIHS
jgi:tetratricopeptide (TPR) repeat protein